MYRTFFLLQFSQACLARGIASSAGIGPELGDLGTTVIVVISTNSERSERDKKFEQKVVTELRVCDQNIMKMSVSCRIVSGEAGSSGLTKHVL